jgi:hypothetical protein
MKWKEIIKDENRNFAEDESAWMERDVETAFDEDRHKRREINELVDAISREIDERLDDAAREAHISYKDINMRDVKKKLLPIIQELVKNHLEFDMSKFKYGGP